MDAHTRRRLSDDVARLADGDRTAFDPVYVAVWPLLRGFCTRLLGDPRDAEDAAQQALLNVFSRASAYDRDQDAIPWLLAIAANECRTVRARTSRRREDPLPPGIASPSSFEADVLAADLAAAIRAVVADLPRADADALTTVLDDALRPDVPAATFRKRVARAANRFADLWRIRHGTP